MVRIRKSGPLEHAELANHIQGFRIPDHWDATEKIYMYLCDQQNREKINVSCGNTSKEI